MALSISDFERELEQAKAELAQVQAEIQGLMARETELTKVVNGWQAIIAAKRRQSGDAEPPGVDWQESRAVAPSRPEGEEGENKTQFVREQLLANVATGITVEDLKKAAAAVGMAHAASWPYGSLARLKAKGQLVKRRGRFYPSGSLLSKPESEQAALMLN